MSTQTTEKPATERKPKIHSGPFSSLQEAQADKTHEGRVKLFVVTWPGEGPTFWWTDGLGSAMVRAAKAKGATVSRSDKVPTQASVASMLAALTPEDRAAVLTQFSGKRSGGK